MSRLGQGDSVARDVMDVVSERLEHHGPGNPASDVETGGLAIEALRREFEELGLSSYEARIVVALLRLGAAAPSQLARAAEVPRTSTYQILEELRNKGLAERVPGAGPAVWSSRGADEVLARLSAAQEELLREHRARAERVREMVTRVFPEAPTPALPFVQVIHEPARVQPLYEEMLTEAQSELLVFNRPPYSWTLGEPNQIVLDAAARVSTRVLYQASEVGDPTAELWHQEMQAYHTAGAVGRVVKSLPLKLAVVDRKVALITVEEPILPHVGFPTTLLVDHPAFAQVQADAFEHLWSTATPYPEVPQG
jgi:sugar-specific transcriptional regulator TrmB